MTQLVVIAPLVPIVVGDEFAQGTVPLHLTLLPTVRVSPGAVSAVEAAIRDVAATAHPITARAGAYEAFGKNGDVRVTTVEATPDLQHLHVLLFEGVRSAGGVATEPAYNLDGYRPHVTHTHDHHVIRTGEEVTLKALAVLDCSQPLRRISTTVDLTGAR